MNDLPKLLGLVVVEGFLVAGFMWIGLRAMAAIVTELARLREELSGIQNAIKKLDR